MTKSPDFYKDLLIGVLYISGVAGFMSGEIIASATMVGLASLISNIQFRGLI